MSEGAETSLNEARQKVRRLLDAAEKSMAEFGWGLRSEAEQVEHEKNCRLAITQIEDYDFGWLFHYNSTVFIETGETRHALVGNAPYLIERKTGKVFETGTAYSVEHYLELYRRSELPTVEG